MKNDPLVSIVIATLGNRETLTRAVSSVLAQSYANWEIILVCNKKDVLTKFSLEKTPKIILVDQKEFGIYQNFNLGIEMAHGKLIGILNDDDWYEPNFLKDSIDLIESRDLDGSYGDCWIHYENCKKFVEANKFLQKRCLLDFTGAYHTTFLLKRECFQEYGLFPLKTSSGVELKYASDYYWFTNAFKMGLKVVKCESIKGNFSIGGASSVERLNLIREGKAAALDLVESSYKKLIVYAVWQTRLMLNRFKLVQH